jgi:hypothetical protein
VQLLVRGIRTSLCANAEGPALCGSKGQSPALGQLHAQSVGPESSGLHPVNERPCRQRVELVSWRDHFGCCVLARPLRASTAIQRA